MIFVLLWCLVAVCMGIIFAFSAENAADSAEKSNGILAFILRLFDGRLDSYSPEKQAAILEKYSFYIRKTAHFSIYTLLGFLTANAFAYQKHLYGFPSKKKVVVFSVAIGALYAVTDELHQYFVPGRSCSLRDMLIDSAGVTAGVFLSLTLIHMIHKHKHNTFYHK